MLRFHDLYSSVSTATPSISELPFLSGFIVFTYLTISIPVFPVCFPLSIFSKPFSRFTPLSLYSDLEFFLMAHWSVPPYHVLFNLYLGLNFICPLAHTSFILFLLSISFICPLVHTSLLLFISFLSSALPVHWSVPPLS